eukprot:3723161-Pyramimonas_sp.AAC.1
MQWASFVRATWEPKGDLAIQTEHEKGPRDNQVRASASCGPRMLRSHVCGLPLSFHFISYMFEPQR